MSYLDKLETVFFNTEADIFDEDDAIVDQNFRSFKSISYNKNDFWLSDYIYYSNDDDDYLSNLIDKKFNKDNDIDESNTNCVTLIQDKDTSCIASNRDEKTVNNDNFNIVSDLKTVEIEQKPIINAKHISTSIHRSGWKVVASANNIKVDSNIGICVSYQIYNNKHYIVLSKIYKNRKPRNFAIPVSVSEFIANRITEAFNKKNKILVTNNPTAKEWLLCKNYGTIYPHPENYITISHQKYKTRGYIVLAKYDWHKNPRTFAFPINSSFEIRDALLKEYKRGKRNGEKIYKYFFK